MVYNVNYHFIWCPKYRKPILEEAGVKEFLEDQIHTIAATKECEVLALEVMPDIFTSSFQRRRLILQLAL